MKKYLLAIVAVLMFGTNIRAQKYGPWDMYIGPRAGVVVNNFTTCDGGDYNIGALAGFNAEVFFTKHISLNMGFNYTRQGYKNLEHYYTSYDYNLDYVNTEFLFRYYPGYRFCVFTGLDFGRLVRSRIVLENGSERSINSYLHRGTVAIPVGMAVNFKNIDLNVAYRYQLNKLGRASFNKYIGDAHNQSLTASIFYKIRLF